MDGSQARTLFLQRQTYVFRWWAQTLQRGGLRPAARRDRAPQLEPCRSPGAARSPPTVQDGRKIIGVDIAPAIVRFPFQVTLNIDTEIGGPSAGLMFSLGIYDTLTPGSLTGGETIAGTGTMDLSGTVGPIGGIDQKIAASRNAGAEIFLVPADNCADVKDARPGDMRLVKVTTLSDAVASVKAWDSDHSASLPSCSTTAKAASDG